MAGAARLWDGADCLRITPPNPDPRIETMPMDMELKETVEALQTALRSVGAEVSSPWFYLQFGLILAGAGIAFGTNAAIRTRFDTRTLAKRWQLPVMRHFMGVLVESAATAVFAILMIVGRVTMWHLTWPSRSYLLMVCAKLALAWIAIRLVTSVIQNAFIVRLVSLAAWLVAALSIVRELDWAAETLDSVAIEIGGLRLSPLLVIKAGALLLLALWVTNIASNFAESRINRASDLTPSVQVLLIKIIRISLMAVAIVIALGTVGINLSALAVFSGAVGVGIGIGLQKIVANFISGIILLADKSVKPGDLVTIGDNSGRISAMKTRYISVAAGDGREFLIPNEDLVTQRVTNWTYTDKNTLVKIAFSTNYDADPKLVCKLAADTAAAHPRATKGKPPNCILTEFAEAGMKFSLTFWIAEPDGMDNVKSDVMLALWEAFKRDGIRVPYPVREIRVRGGALPVESVVEVSS
jgi:small-conductance mechanosensitive channel